jgi:hypothetical protein
MKKLPARLAMLGLLACVCSIVPAAAAQINRTTTLNDEAPPAPTETDLTTPKFATAIDDLPLMPGLNLMENNDIIFGSPGVGRIVETEAVGAVDIDDVYNFYARTLPHMGWKSIDMRRYRRDQDLLRIDAHADGKNTVVHFAIHPLSTGK